MRRYRLHYAPDNASLVVRLALEELGQSTTPFVDRAAREQTHRNTARSTPPG